MPRTARDRQQAVLNALVRLYIERREPVSSRMLEESGQLDIRSASIRSVLHELEADGYLVQPHASSGRVPTDLGYRAYVDSMRLNEDSVDPQALEEVGRAVREAGADLEQMLHAIHRVLGRLTHNIAILGGPRQKSPQIVGVDLYQRDSRHVFVLISLEGGAVRTELVRLDREVVPEMVFAAATVLVDRFAGHTLEEVRASIESLAPEPTTPPTSLARDVALTARGLFDPGSILQFNYEGVSEALRQPEFADPERLKALLELMSRSDDFESTLERTLRTGTGQIALAIGRENSLPALHPFSLLATRFEVDDRVGYLAVLGPRRMHYAQTVTLIRLIARHLDRNDL
jgi:heat-inducible transcriptional repressor